MKKLLITFLIINSLVLNIKAEENHTVTITYDLKPNYTVKLPKSIDITSNVNQLTYYIKADLYANQSLVVKFDSMSYLKDQHRTIPVTVTQNKTEYSYQELNDDYISQTIELTHDLLPAGQYQGSLNVEIYLANH